MMLGALALEIQKVMFLALALRSDVKLLNICMVTKLCY